jgi:hypothetical protein
MGHEFVQFCFGILILGVTGIAAYITYRVWDD